MWFPSRHKARLQKSPEFYQFLLISPSFQFRSVAIFIPQPGHFSSSQSNTTRHTTKTSCIKSPVNNCHWTKYNSISTSTARFWSMNMWLVKIVSMIHPQMTTTSSRVTTIQMGNIQPAIAAMIISFFVIMQAIKVSKTRNANNSNSKPSAFVGTISKLFRKCVYAAYSVCLKLNCML